MVPSRAQYVTSRVYACDWGLTEALHLRLDEPRSVLSSTAVGGTWDETFLSSMHTIAMRHDLFSVFFRIEISIDSPLVI